MGVHIIAEISTAAGNEITQEAWEGKQERPTATLWPIQSKPGNLSFQSWRNIMDRVFLKPQHINLTKKSHQRKLQTRLGDWFNQSK